MVGFLHLILPNARVINTFRHPIDTLLGNYKQLFGHGQNFTYDMHDLADYYKQYHATIQHWHEVLPGKVLDVHYEDTVLDLEENPRSVKTASSEQVRQPIYTGALGTWRRYEEHLDFWKEEMADIIATLPKSVRKAGL